MPLKSNLSPEVKDRLRRAVLGEINPSQAKPVKSPVASKKIATIKSASALASVASPGIAMTAPKPAVASSVKIKKAKRPAKKAKMEKAKSKTAASKAKSKVKKVIAVPIARPAKSQVLSELKPVKSPFRHEIKATDFIRQSRDAAVKQIENQPAKSQILQPKKNIAKPRHRIISALIKIIIVLLLLAILAAGVDLLGVYKFGFRDVYSEAVVRILPFPAGRVNQQSIGLYDYLQSVRLLNYAVTQNREGIYDYSGQTEIGARIFARLAAEKLMADKLAAYGATITDKDIDDQLAQLLTQAGGQSELANILQTQYGLTLSQFKERVLKSLVMRDKLQSLIVKDDSLPITAAAKSRAEKILALALIGGENFNDLAKQYTEDESGVNTGGDLGWVARGQLSAEWEDAIFSATPGTVINHLVASNFGFHIIKVEQKVKDAATGIESVKLRHILIKVDVDQYIKSLLDNAQMVKYVAK